MADYDLQYQDTHIDALLATANELKTAGYIYKGVATPSTNPGTPTDRVAYLASEPGTYTNFGGIVIASGLYSLTYAGGTWTGTQMSAGSDCTRDLSLGNSYPYAVDNSGKWTNSAATHYIIRCNSGDVFRITAGTIYCNCRWLTKNTKTQVQGDTAYVSTIEPDPIIINANETADITAPSDAVQLYIMRTYNGNDYTPQSVKLLTEYSSIMDEMYDMPTRNVAFRELARLTPYTSYPLNNYNFFGGQLTLTFTTNKHQALTYTGCLTIGNTYKINVKIRKTSNNNGQIQLGSTFGSSATDTTYITIPASTTEQVVTGIFTAISNDFVIGANSAFNKGETYIISSILVEDITNCYVSNAALTISQLEYDVMPTITDLQSYINKGGDVFLPAGTYTAHNLIIPNGTYLHGVAGATIIQLTSGQSNIISLTNTSSDITIEGIVFKGNSTNQASSSWFTASTLSQLRNRTGEGTTCGIYAQGFSWKISIKNCIFQLFDLAGIRLYRTHEANKYFYKWKITDCHFVNNWYGLLSDVRSEYHTIMGCSFNSNQVGAFVAGGNNTFSECKFEANGTGFVVSGTAGENDSHGSAGTCSFNHNVGFGIAVIDINNGYSFTGCHVFDGTGIVVSNSIGFCYVGGMVACKIVVDTERNAGYNMFADDIFTTTYSGGTIDGNPARLSMHGNRFLAQNDCTAINNNV